MKIKITEPGYPDIQPLEIDLECREVTLREVYNGIGIETDQGRFGIAERDGGIEVMLNGELIWSSTEYIDAGAGEVRQSIYHDVDRYNTTDAVREGDNLPSCSLCGHQMGTAARPIGGIEETTGQPICEQCRVAVELEPKNLPGGTIVDENGKKLKIPPELEEVARRHAEWDGKSPHPYGCDGGEDPDDAGDDRNSLAREARRMLLRYWRKD